MRISDWSSDVCSSDLYVAGLQAEPPYGSLAAVKPGEAVRVHFSSGTTARPAPVLWTQADIDRWAELYCRYLYAQGLRRGDVFQCMFNYAWFVGGLGATLAAQQLGDRKSTRLNSSH